MIGLFSLESCWNAHIPSTTAIKTEKEKERRERKRWRERGGELLAIAVGREPTETYQYRILLRQKVTKEGDYVQRETDGRGGGDIRSDLSGRVDIATIQLQ